MIQLFENRADHFGQCSKRERLAALAAPNRAIRDVHIRLAELFDREAQRLPLIANPDARRIG